MIRKYFKQFRARKKARKLVTVLDDVERESLNAFNETVEIVQNAVDSGASEEQVGLLDTFARTCLAQYAVVAQDAREQAFLAGADDELLDTLPDGLAFVQENIPRLDVIRRTVH